jgi:hypothetical protein
MKITDEFEEKKYVLLRGLVSDDTCNSLADYLKIESKKNGWFDEQCPKSKALKNDSVFDKLLVELLPEIETVTGKKLLPSYSYARLYKPDDSLDIHLDREACEISLTLTLGFDGSVWPIYMAHPSEETNGIQKYSQKENKNINIKMPNSVSLEVGDAVLYKGCEVYHWREKYTEGKWQAQVFLHYVDANGPNREWAYDKMEVSKKKMKIENKVDSDDLVFWYYNDVLTSSDCDVLINAYSKVTQDEAGIGNPNGTTVDKSIRNVSKVDLPTYKGIGAILTAAGIDANQQRWKFDINKSNQCEFLKYSPDGGRYRGHIDTFLTTSPRSMLECRKLTVLAFLNDDFEGGKFFLQVGTNKFYPPQTKGTILVFPSFLLHGVEDVTKGVRCSVVCWLVGPWFK